MGTETTDLETLKYNELKQLAAERGLSAQGTREELLARLRDGGQDGPTVSEQAEAPKPKEEVKEEKKSKDIEVIFRSRVVRQKAYLDAQPKVMVLVPFDAGEKPEQAKTIPFHVSINGYAMDIPRGVMVEVPKDVARMVQERLESEGRIGREHRVDASAAKMEALS